MMRLKRFRVTNFRSVDDSGWIDCDDVTTLVGVNEAGKSNLILALWKFNPARGGAIEPLYDMPASKYAEWRGHKEDIEFIQIEFELDEAQINQVVSMCGCDPFEASVVLVEKRYNNRRSWSFPNYRANKIVPSKPLKGIVERAIADLSELNEVTQKEKGLKDRSQKAYNDLLGYLNDNENISQETVGEIRSFYPEDKSQSATSEISPFLAKTKESIEGYLATTKPVNPNTEEVRELLASQLPTFVYYSNYGNLDAQIYLPHVTKWLNGESVEGQEISEDKVRTLRVLFEFVNLDPDEIMELGEGPITRKVNNYNKEIVVSPTEEAVNEHMKSVEERFALLSSAATSLTNQFRDWWKQGDYTFRFEADGGYFRILVSDDKRPDEIKLEKRSTGLQWFLSFFLVFLVEKDESHKGSVLLLDEAGLSLHPLAQKDLIVFFNELSGTNQIVNTTHSPFLIDTNNIDRVKVVYVDDGGKTVSSGDLRIADDKLSRQSVYAAHAALGLSVSDMLLQGCCPIIVEGTSDQHYLNAIKTYSIRNKKIAPKEELIFMPSGGVKGIPQIASIIGGKEGELPIVLVDDDESGRNYMNKLSSGLYKGQEALIRNVGNYTNYEFSEVEDLIPFFLMKRHLDRLFRDIESEYIEDVIEATRPIVPQIEEFAKKHNVALEIGWKVELAKSVKHELLNRDSIVIPNEYFNSWVGLFEGFDN